MITKKILCPSSLDLKDVAGRASDEISAMGYLSRIEKTENGYSVSFEKDIGGIDTFVGRWQNSVIDIVREDEYVVITAHGHKKADKIIAVFTGLMFYALPWILSGVARHNRKHAEEVTVNVIETYIRKNTSDEN